MTSPSLIEPTDLRDFLKANGWRMNEDALGDRLYALESDAHPRRQLVFPMDRSAPDYLDSSESVIKKFAAILQVSESAVKARIRALRDDVLRLRIFFDGDDSVLPLSFASAFVRSTEHMFKAAACTVLRPRIHHPRLTLNEATRFVENARFGQTEIGSFVLNVACPINSMEGQGGLFTDFEGAPFVRQVTVSLHNSLHQLTAAIESDTVEHFLEQLKLSPVPSVSSNLCEALAEMHDDQINNSLDLQFDWSILSNALRPQSMVPVRLQPAYFTRIEEIRRAIRAVELDEIGTYIGTVERLDGELGPDGRRSGEVVLSLLLPDEGETVRARTMLSAESYADADRAHMGSSTYVRVTGCLRPGRQPRQLTNLTNFELLNA